jgi:hypothetical protein
MMKRPVAFVQEHRLYGGNIRQEMEQMQQKVINSTKPALKQQFAKEIGGAEYKGRIPRMGVVFLH